MSELKSFIVLYDGKFIRAYKESEADKVIAELETKNASLTEEINEWVRSAANRPTIIGRLRQHIAVLDNELRHSNYKRCLAMARLCNEKWIVHNFAEIPTKLGFYDKWEKRWLELAEQFKPNKSTAQ